MTVEFLIIGIGLGVGLVSSALTSPLLWRNLLKRKSIVADAEHNGIELTEFSNYVSFICIEIAFIAIICMISSSCFILCRRISLFCGGTLAAVLCFVTLKTLHQFCYYKEKNKKVVKILFSILAIYLVFFTYDNVMFSNALSNIQLDKKSDIVTLSKEILPETLTISAEDMLNLMNSSTTSTYYKTNGKLVSYAGTNYFIIIDNEGIDWIKCDNPDPFATPMELLFKNTKELGLRISDQNNIYFVYALLSQKSFLSQYEVIEYALYDPFSQKVTYSDIPPNF